MCNTPEAFLSLRSHFICSHALLCVSHWVLGIGDRHLSNFMINIETGGMIGIDFGHAFGSATQVSHNLRGRCRKDLFLCLHFNGEHLEGHWCISQSTVSSVPPSAWAHAFSTDSAVCQSDAATEGVWFDSECHGPLPPSLRCWSRPFTQHHGCVCQRALARLEGKFLIGLQVKGRVFHLPLLLFTITIIYYYYYYYYYYLQLVVALGGDQCKTIATCRLNSLLQPQ